MTTSDGAKPTGKKKKKPAEPRASERAYLLIELGQSLDGAETKRAPKGFNVPFRTGPNLQTEYGRECARERAGLLPWLRRQHARCDEVGILGEALRTHEASLEDGEAPPDSWVKILSRIGRNRIQHFLLGSGGLRAAVEQAREEFRALPSEEQKHAAAFAEAAE